MFPIDHPRLLRLFGRLGALGRFLRAVYNGDPGALVFLGFAAIILVAAGIDRWASLRARARAIAALRERGKWPPP